MSNRGVFIAFEGGEGAGKSTQTRMLHDWLTSLGRSVHVTVEPGGTDIGRNLREILLGHDTGALAPRTEALLYAADRAEHVATVIRPHLDSGHVVITDRYIDSSLAYQGAGRALAVSEVAHVSLWAADQLLPDLTVVLDIDPEVGLRRFDTPADRLEAEPLSFHQRVRQQFLDLAAAEPDRYLMVDATSDPDDVHQRVRHSLEALLR